MSRKNAFLLLFCLLYYAFWSQNGPRGDGFDLRDISFFPSPAWHDSVFPKKGFASLNSLLSALKYGRSTNNIQLQAYAGVTLANWKLGEKKYTEAFDALNRTLLLDTLLHPLSPVRQYMYMEASRFYTDFGTFRIAAKYLKKTIDINLRRDTVPTVRMYGYYSAYANLFHRMGFNDSCYFYYGKAIDEGKKVNRQWEASGLNNYGIALLQNGHVDTAMKTFLLAKSKVEAVEGYDTSFYFSINDNIGDVFAFKHQYAQALPYYNLKFVYNFWRHSWVQTFNSSIKCASTMIKLGDVAGARKRLAVLDSLRAIGDKKMTYDRRENYLKLCLELAEYTHNTAEINRVNGELVRLKNEVIADAQNDRLSKLENVLLENMDRFAKEIEIDKLRLEESKARARSNKIFASSAIVLGVLIISIIVLQYRRRIAMNHFAFRQETYKRQLAETTLQNEQLDKIRLNQELELNKVTIEQESYKRKLAETTLINEQLGKSQLKQQLDLNKAAIEQESYKRELAEINFKNEQLEKTQISQQLELKKRDVTDYALAYSQRKKILDEILTKLKEIKKSQNPEEQLQELSKSLKKQLQGHSEMEMDAGGIEKVNHEFFEKLNEICPDLTAGEKDLTGLIRLNFSSKEISSLRNISPSSVRMSKFRLKKKLGLNPEDDLVEFIRKV